MKKLFFSLLIIPVSIPGALFMTSTAGFADSATKWSYDPPLDDRQKRKLEESKGIETGPAQWANLDAAYALCGSGKNQSPVNIDAKNTADGEPRGLKFNYGLINPGVISNTGKAIHITIGEGSNIQIDGLEFGLKSVDFHIPSEHTFNGEHFPMEIQFTHETGDGVQATVSRMVIPGRPDRSLQKITAQLPMQSGQFSQLQADTFRNLEFKQKRNDFYRYDGSSTTPPCQEGVRWFLMKKPMTISKAQYQAFKQALGKDNNRPVQPLHARLIAE